MVPRDPQGRDVHEQSFTTNYTLCKTRLMVLQFQFPVYTLAKLQKLHLTNFKPLMSVKKHERKCRVLWNTTISTVMNVPGLWERQDNLQGSSALTLLSWRAPSSTASAWSCTWTWSSRTWWSVDWPLDIGVRWCQSHIFLQVNTSPGSRLSWLWFWFCLFLCLHEEDHKWIEPLTSMCFLFLTLHWIQHQMPFSIHHKDKNSMLVHIQKK